MTTSGILLAIAGLVAVTLVTRGFFLLPSRDLPMPAWLREALRYAPLGALAAIIAPDIFIAADGHLVRSLLEPRLVGAAAGTAWFLWRRTMLGTIIVGTATMLLARMLLA